MTSESKSVRQMRAAGLVTQDGRRVDSSASIPERRKKRCPLQPRSKFTDCFRLGDVVWVQHSNLVRWDDHGHYGGKIIEISEGGAVVLDRKSGMRHEVDRVRDLVLDHRPKK